MASAGWHGHESDANPYAALCLPVSCSRGLVPSDDNRLRVSSAASSKERVTRTAAPSATYPATIATELASSASREISPKPSLATSFAFMVPSVVSWSEVDGQ